MKGLSRLLPFVAAVAAVACAEQGTLEPRREGVLAASTKAASQITVMTRNMYVGADVDPVLNALIGGGDVQGALQTALAELQRTDFPTRISGIADEVARNRPYVLGLQEAYEMHLDLAALGLGTGTIDLNFPAAIEAALAARGLNYLVANQSELTNAVLMGGAVTLADHDMLLYDPAHVTLLPGGFWNIFQYNLLDGVPNVPFPVLRGYIVQPAVIEGVTTLVLNSHTEAGNTNPLLAQLRGAQATELAAVIAAAGVPHVLLMGDLNDTPGTPLYEVLVGAGLTDTWAAMRPGVAGYSCCELPDLSNRIPTLDQRIDYIWSMGFAGPSGKPQGQVALTSDNPSGLLQGAYGTVWPSDHAGLVATLLLPAVQR